MVKYEWCHDPALWVGGCLKCQASMCDLNYVCKAHTSCRLFLHEPVRDWYYVYRCCGGVAAGEQQFYQALEELPLSGEGPSRWTLTIGPNSLDEDGESYASFAKKKYNNLFIEAQQSILPSLNVNLEKYGLTSFENQSVVITKAFCPWDDVKWVDFIAPANVETESSAQQSKLGSILPIVGIRPGMEKIPVPCVHAAELFSDVGLRPQDVLVFLTDMEGVDFDTIFAFFEIPGFRPEIIRFEWHVTHALGYIDGPLGYLRAEYRMWRLLQRLSGLGYTSSQLGVDFVATLSGPSLHDLTPTRVTP